MLLHCLEYFVSVLLKPCVSAIAYFVQLTFSILSEMQKVNYGPWTQSHKNMKKILKITQLTKCFCRIR